MEPCEQPIVSLSNPSHASISLMMVPDNDMQTAQSPLTYLLWIFISHDLWPLWMLFTQQYILHLLLDSTIIAEQYPAAPLCAIVCKSLPPPLCVSTFTLRSSKSIILLHWISTYRSVRLWAHLIDDIHHRGV